jgi:hypothetical protein
MHDKELRKLVQSQIEGVPLSGDIFWVSNASDYAYEWLRGKVPTANLLTSIDEAVGRCTAQRGDVIVACPYYNETVSAASQVDLDVAGISLIGLGHGTAMPMLDYTVAAGEMAIGAPNVLVQGIRFHSHVTAVLKGIDVEAAALHTLIRKCWFDVETTTTDEFNSVIDIAAGANYTKVEDCYIDMGLGGATQAIHLNGTSANISILRNKIWGDYSTACIAGSTAASTLVDIGHNVLVNGTGGDLGTKPCIELNGNSSGMIYHNLLMCNVANGAASVVAAYCFLYENYYNETVASGASGTLTST